jgi:hypothetical protein
MKEIRRQDLMDIEDYAEIFNKESHHEHRVIEDEHGVLRWEADPVVNEIVDRVNLNDIWLMFMKMGLTKNSEPVRKLYRDMGYSLSGYWEIFYWEVNNEDAEDYHGVPV